MGLSIFVTTVEERSDIALQLIPSAVQIENGGLKGAIERKRLREPRQEISYNPKTDSFAVLGKNISGDLLDLYCYLKNIDRTEGATQFCEEFELDIDWFNHKKELMDFVGYIPDVSNISLGKCFESLSYITKVQAKELTALYGWKLGTLKKFRITMMQDGDETRVAFPIVNKAGRVIAFKTGNASNVQKTKLIGSDIESPYIFPDTKLLDINAPILVTIGYIDALCALSQGIDATGIIDWNGNKLPDGLLSKFQNRDVAIGFPASKRAIEYAMTLAEALHPTAKSVNVVKWPDTMNMPDTNGQRLYEYFVKCNGTLESLNTLMRPFKSNEPLPLRRELQPAMEYPVDALPPILRGAVLDVSDAMQCSPALPAQSFLSVSALAVQAHMNIEIDGRKSPSSCFFVTIAESGERKSSIDKIAMSPVFEREAELRVEIKEQTSEYYRQVEIYKKCKADALKSPNPNQALKDLGSPPERPLDASLTCEEPTYEALVIKMVHGQPSIGIFSDEGGRFLGGAAMNKDNQQKTATGLSTLWDGRSISRARVKEGSITLDGRRVSMHLMLQPVIAEQLLGSDLLIGQGLMSRILVAYPQSTIGSREYSSINLKDSVALGEYNKLIGEILSIELPIKPGTTNELEPATIELTGKAKKRWIEFHNHVEAEMKVGHQYYNIRGFAAKSAEHVLRLACILTCLNDPHTAENIPVQWINSAISIVEYHISEALRLFNVSYDAPEIRLAEECLEWIQRKYPIFSLTEIIQGGPSKLRNRKAAAMAVKILEDHGWVRPIPGGAIIDYDKRRQAWQVYEG